MFVDDTQFFQSFSYLTPCGCYGVTCQSCTALTRAKPNPWWAGIADLLVSDTLGEQSSHFGILLPQNIWNASRSYFFLWGVQFSGVSPVVKLQGNSSALWTLLEGNTRALTE